jgi:hypothetical protein
MSLGYQSSIMKRWQPRWAPDFEDRKASIRWLAFLTGGKRMGQIENGSPTTATTKPYRFQISIGGGETPALRGGFTFPADSPEHALELLEKVTGPNNATITIISGPSEGE